MNNINLKIGPRFVKQDKNGFRPFQKKILQAINDPTIKIIEVEAPVGTGKSHITRQMIESSFCGEKPIVLNFITTCI